MIHNFSTGKSTKNFVSLSYVSNYLFNSVKPAKWYDNSNRSYPMLIPAKCSKWTNTSIMILPETIQNFILIDVLLLINNTIHKPIDGLANYISTNF